MKELKMYFKTMWAAKEPLVVAFIFFIILSYIGETPNPFWEIALKAVGVVVAFFTVAYFCNKFNIKI